MQNKIIKNFLVLTYAFLFTNLSAFAEYKPIPTELSKQYKHEMEHIIDKNYPTVLKNINKEVKNAKYYYNQTLKNGFNIENYINLTLISETSIPSTDLELYAKLMQVTQEKYLGEKYTPLGIDTTITIDKFLTPYFEDNNVNTKKLSKIIIYQNNQSKIVEKYIKQVELLR